MKAQIHKWFGGSIILLVAVALIIGLGPLSPVASSAEVAQVSVDPANQEVLVTRSGSLDLRVDDVEGLFAVELHLTYNPSVISIADANAALAGVQVAAGDIFAGMGWHVDSNVVDPVAGTIYYQFGLDMSEPAGVTGGGVLAQIDFRGIAPGSSPIVFDDVTVELSARGGESIPRTVANGTVRVTVLPSTSTLTPTSTGAAAPTATPTRTGTVATATRTPSATATTTATAEPGAPHVYVSPETRWVIPGGTSYVDIMIDGAANVYGAWLSATFDTSHVQVLSIEPVVGTTRDTGYLFPGTDWYELGRSFSNSSGIMTYGAKLSFDQPAGTDSGILARVHFRGLALGTSPFAFNEIILTDRQGVSLLYTSTDGQIVVSNDAPTETITPTVTETVTATPTVTSVPTAFVYLDPEVESLAVGGEADVSVNVGNVSDLYGVEFVVDYDPSVLEVLDADAGVAGTQIEIVDTFLSPDSVLQNAVSQATGRIRYAVTQSDPSPAVSGAGMIASIRVRALAQGASPLALHSTQLTNSGGAGIAHGAAGGFVAVNARIITGRVELQGRTSHLGVSLTGGAGETYANSLDDGGFVFECPAAVGETLTVNASCLGYLSASAVFVVPGDQVIDLGDIALYGGDVVSKQIEVDRAGGCAGDPTVVMPGLPDNKINILDLAFVGAHFGDTSAVADWEPSGDGCNPDWIVYRSDINGDDVCDIYDLVLVGNNFGAIGPAAW